MITFALDTYGLKHHNEYEYDL